MFEFGKRTLTDEDRRELSESDFVSLSDGTTHYEWTGATGNQPVIFVHGLSSSMFIWDPQFEYFTDQGRSVLRYDLFGRGLSDRPAVRYDTDFYVRQLEELIDRVTENPAVTLVGLSLGGAIATAYTARNHERVDRLFLVAPAGLPERMPWWYELITTRGLTETVYYSLGDLFFRYVSYRNLTTDSDRRKEARRKMQRQLDFKGYIHAIVSTLRYGPVYGQKEAYRMLGEQDCPVEAVWSRTDSVVPYSLHERLEQWVSRVKVRSLEDGCHTINYDRPRPVNQWLRTFLEE